MDMQNVSNLVIPEGEVRTIHDKDSRLIWGRLNYDTKYVGDTLQNGTPTPDTPVSVQTVTGEQTVKVTGKNMAQTTDCNISGTNYSMSISKGSVELKSQATNVCFDLNAGTRLGAWMPNYASAPDHHLTGNGGTYIASFHDTSTSGLNSNTIVGVFTNKRNNSITINNTLPLRNISISLDSDEYVKSILYWIGSGTTDCTIKFKVQLEQGSTSSAYEPYQEKSYPISLGSTELCKIGDYQDYIYQSNGDWYVHKEIGYIDLATQTWGGAGSQLKPTTTITDIKYVSSNQEVGVGLAEKYILRKASGMSGAVGYIAIDTSAVRVNTGDASITPTGLFYYALATVTDTKITDATLVGQLDAVHEWLTRYGYNVTVTGNLPIIIDRTNL